MSRATSRQAGEDLSEGIDQGLARHAARVTCAAALGRLVPWMSEAWIETASNAIAGDRTDLAQLDRLERAAPHIGAYQRFRARVLQLGEDAMAIFAELARVRDKLESLDDEALEPVVRRILGTEARRSEEHTSELQSLMRISYAVFCLKKKKQTTHAHTP